MLIDGQSTLTLTLAQAFEKIVAGASAEKVLVGFLEAFFLAPTAGEKLATIIEAPVPTGKARLDALAGAIAEYLAKQYRLPHVPRWASEPHRYLKSPWHVLLANGDDQLPLLSDPGFREYLSHSSPAEFRSHNIFTEARPLRPGRDGHAQ